MLALPKIKVWGVSYVLQGRLAIHARSGADVPDSGIQNRHELLATESVVSRHSGRTTLAALRYGYIFNRRAPTLLVSQSRVKLQMLVRNVATDALHMYQYPSGYRSGNRMSTEFLKIIALVLLSALEFSEAQPCFPQ
jgi:hypothetical protein